MNVLSHVISFFSCVDLAVLSQGAEIAAIGLELDETVKAAETAGANGDIDEAERLAQKIEELKVTCANLT